jgi:predicted ATPase
MDDIYQKDLHDVLSEAAKSLSLYYNTTKPKGFFFSAEDFTSYIHFLVKEKNYDNEELKRVNKEYKK